MTIALYNSVSTPVNGLTIANLAISGWFMTPSTPTAYAGLIVSRGSPYPFGMGVNVATNTTLTWISPAGFEDTGLIIPIGTWFYAAFVLNQTNYSLYVGDPTANTFKSYTSTQSFTSRTMSAPVLLGEDTTARYWIGPLDDCSIWSNNALAMSNPNLFASSVYDQSLHGHPNTLNWR